MTRDTKYDSTNDTQQHIRRVRELLFTAYNNLVARGFDHDKSKLGPVEKPIFDSVTPKLRGLTYGSEEYKASLAEMKPALDHHYAHNSHHPEHFQKAVCIICFADYPSPHNGSCLYCGNGTFTQEANMAGMSLLDLIEMLCDWKAAGERHADGSITRSLDVNKKRFGISDQLQAILTNTAKELGWL